LPYTTLFRSVPASGLVLLLPVLFLLPAALPGFTSLLDCAAAGFGRLVLRGREDFSAVLLESATISLITSISARVSSRHWPAFKPVRRIFINRTRIRRVTL